jgi:hypothetical protein
MFVILVCKAILAFLCFQIANPTMRALALDHLNDVFSNIIALACGLIGKKKKKKTKYSPYPYFHIFSCQST